VPSDSASSSSNGSKVFSVKIRPFHRSVLPLDLTSFFVSGLNGIAYILYLVAGFVGGLSCALGRFDTNFFEVITPISYGVGLATLAGVIRDFTARENTAEEKESKASAVQRLRHDFRRRDSLEARKDASKLSMKEAFVEMGVTLLGPLAQLLFRPVKARMESEVRDLRERSTRLAQLSASELLSVDSRKPVLYLRSFDGESVELESPRGSARTRLEDVILRLTSFLGPVIAIGNPRDQLPPSGAARDYVGDSEWKELVERWMKEAQLIVITIGSSAGVAWETHTILRREFLGKTVFVFPPVHPAKRSSVFSTLLTRLDSHPSLKSFSELDGARAATAVIDSAGNVGAFVVNSNTTESYRCALKFAFGNIKSSDSMTYDRVFSESGLIDAGLSWRRGSLDRYKFKFFSSLASQFLLQLLFAAFFCFIFGASSWLVAQFAPPPHNNY